MAHDSFSLTSLTALSYAGDGYSQVVAIVCFTVQEPSNSLAERQKVTTVEAAPFFF